MPDVTIIADDLTGAADCGLAFAVAGLPTYVAFGDNGAPDWAQIFVIDIDSRALDSTGAAARARAATSRACRPGSGILYKKIDSTLRGHIGIELAATCTAVAERGGKPVAIIAPAFPKLGRTTREGRVFINGVPLEETEVWRKSGMTGPADLVSMLQLAGLKAEVAAKPEAIAGLVARGVQAIVCDAMQEEDLQHIAEAGARISAPVIWVGSAGLARHLPAAFRLQPSSHRPPRCDRPSGPILTLVGSRSTIAREQARLLSAEPGVENFVLDPAMLLAGETSGGWAQASAAIGQALASGRDVVALIGLGTSVDLRQATVLAAALGRFAAPQVGKLGGLVATGGDTAKAVLTAIGARGTHLTGEVETGVPLGIADLVAPLPLVTKSGAFGTPAALQRCRAALKQRST